MNCKHILLSVLICNIGIAAMAQNDGLVLNKSVANTVWDKSTVSKLTLEAYASGEAVITESVEQTPCDIVLVVDVSGSMNAAFPTESYMGVTQGYSAYDIVKANSQTKNPYYYLKDGVYYEVTYISVFINVQCFGICYEKDGVKYYFNGSGEPTTAPYGVPLAVEGNLVGGLQTVIWTGTLYRKAAKMEVFKNAVCDFIDIVADSAVKNGIDHKISLVKFASDKYYNYSESSLEEGDELMNDTTRCLYDYFSNGIPVNRINVNGITGFYYNDDYRDPVPEGAPIDSIVSGYTIQEVNGSQVVKNLKDVRNADNVVSLKASVNGLTAVGATAADYGMTKAKYIYGNANPSYVPGDTLHKRNKVVVMFTDGTPTYGNEFDDMVANNAIAAAKELKDEGATVYTIGLLDGLDTDMYKYMSYVSSKYPSATALDASGNDSADADYFFYVTSAEGLTSVFENIAKQSSSGGAILSNLNESTEVKDVLTKYFKLPEGTETSDIKVYTADYDATNATFGDTTPADNVTISFADDNKTINVNGFDFSAHWCGPNAPDGQKLVIEIPIAFNNVPEDKSFDWTQVPTNETESAVYAPDGTLVKRFPVPYADLSAVVLPIELLSFHAECIDNAIQFTWSTATETNNEYFTIESSEDALHYTAIARIEGAGTSAWQHDYSYMADSRTDRVMYYRLRQTDIDGACEVFSPIAVQCGHADYANVVVYPVPATDCLHIVSHEPISHVQFHNVYGNCAKQVTVNNTHVGVDISGLSDGVYMVKISMNNGTTITKKIIKSTYQH